MDHNNRPPKLALLSRDVPCYMVQVKSLADSDTPYNSIQLSRVCVIIYHMFTVNTVCGDVSQVLKLSVFRVNTQTSVNPSLSNVSRVYEVRTTRQVWDCLSAVWIM